MLKYGKNWDESYYDDDLKIEMGCIEFGIGDRIEHYENMRRIIWPELDDHRWHRLCRDEILKNKVVVLMGPGSSGKTHTPAWIRLCEYWCFPQETLVLVSSTDMRSLRMRIWGEISGLWQKGVERFDYLSGHLIDSRMAITTDSIKEDDFDDRKARDMRKGIVGIPTVQNGKFVGLGKWIGIKQKRMRLVADEVPMMGISFLSAFSNLNKNESFEATLMGNPNDIMDPLGKAAEPKDGWSSHLEPEKTTCWDTRFMGGRCVNLVGTDSPNFDFPQDKPTRYKYLISREHIADTLSFFPKDSYEYYSQCIGVMKIGTMERRVITRDMCQKFGAFKDVVWSGKPRISVAAMDSAYGGDRCVIGRCEFGEDVEGKTIINFRPPEIVPIMARSTLLPEEQIAQYIHTYCVKHGIPPENFFHDSTGRGTLGTYIGREWSDFTNPVEFGGSATDRTVALDLYMTDPKTHQKRLKKCSEHYSKFVTELWWSVRYAIECGQIRNFPEDVMEEMCMRMWDKVGGNKIEVEPKDKMKERTGRSPDLGDWASLCVEGARRRGFNITKIGDDDDDPGSSQWIRTLQRRQETLRSNHSLTYS